VNYLIKCVVLALSIFFSAHSAMVSSSRASDISITNAFFFVPLGNSKATMAFFTITNNSNSDIAITGVGSNSAQQIQLMPESTLLIPAHQSVALKSSGRYLQINDLKTKLSTGDELHLVVSLSNGQKLPLIALAKSAYDQAHGH
jgi:copper(I)-binding protein